MMSEERRLSRLSVRLQAWKARGFTEEYRGQKIHVFHLPKTNRKSEGPPKALLLLLHGYPNSSYDWHRFIELLEAEGDSSESNYAILAFDFLGFGFSDKPPAHDYSLLWQADLTETLVEKFGQNLPVFVAAHDMGTTVACELFARDTERALAFDLRGGLLFNGNMDMGKASLILGQKLLRNRTLGGLFARLSTFWIFKWQLGTVFGSRFPLTSEEARDQWELLTWNGGREINHKLIGYTFERVERADRFLGAFRDWKKPVTLVWGMEDSVATTWQLEGLAAMRSGVPVLELPGLGHFPQIEDPKTFLKAFKSVLKDMNFN